MKAKSVVEHRNANEMVDDSSMVPALGTVRRAMLTALATAIMVSTNTMPMGTVNEKYASVDECSQQISSDWYASGEIYAGIPVSKAGSNQPIAT